MRAEEVDDRGFADELRACRDAAGVLALLSSDENEEAVGGAESELSDVVLHAVWSRALSFSGRERGRALGVLGALATLSAAYTIARPPFLVAAKRRSIACIDAAREHLHELLDDAHAGTRVGAAMLLSRASDVTPSLDRLVRRAVDERVEVARAACQLAVVLAARRAADQPTLCEAIDRPRGRGIAAVLGAVARILVTGEIESSSIAPLARGVCHPRSMPMELGFLTSITVPETTDELVGEALLHVAIPDNDPRFVRAFARMAPRLAPEIALCIALGIAPGDPDGSGASPGDRLPRSPPVHLTPLMEVALARVRRPLEPWLQAALHSK